MIKIEKKLVLLRKSGIDYSEVATTIGHLNIGESFVIPYARGQSNISSVATYIGYAMGRKFATHVEGPLLRIGRIK